MKEFKITYFFDEVHYVRRFIFIESQQEAEKLVKNERDQYISFTDSRGYTMNCTQNMYELFK